MTAAEGPAGCAPPRLVDALWAAVGGLALRLVVVAWAAERIPPTADGAFYHVVAGRIAAGHGYTWLWPDGAVTHAAHYPVGYPAAVGLLYALFGTAPVWAMLLNAVVGAVAVIAVHQVAASVTHRAGARWAAVLAAVHPALVAYTPALMTEGVVAALLAIAAWLVVLARATRGTRRLAWLLVLGLVLGGTTLVRPQIVLVAPFFGALASCGEGRVRPLRLALAAGLVAALAVATVLPWTVRNCLKMGEHPGTFDRQGCHFVSANGGWNLLIGAAPGATGAWVPIEQAGLPDECREVFAEAAKDRCFERAARRYIAERPGRWLGLAPVKLGVTFNGCGAAGYYLEAANAQAFPSWARQALDVGETVFQRLLLLACLAALWRARWRGRWDWGTLTLGAVLAVGALFAALREGFVGYLALAGGALLLGRSLGRHPPAALAAVVLVTTAGTHAVFFGAGRYSMVCFLVMAALAGTVLGCPASRKRAPG